KCVAVRRVREGGACMGDDNAFPSAPAEWLRCDVGLQCTPHSASSVSLGVCLTFAEEGDACTELGRRCKPGLHCVQGTCARLGTEGDTCVGYGDCEQGLDCDPTKKCAMI